MYSLPCTGTNCSLCKESLSAPHRNRHWINYLVSINSTWRYHIDHPKFKLDTKQQWTYVAVPIQDLNKCQSFMREVVGKPLNYNGIFSFFILNKSGCLKSNVNPSSRPGFFCSECFTGKLISFILNVTHVS